ncbi:hypothetical protein DFLDMN_001853 [Cupriavidus sp. H19C3]
MHGQVGLRRRWTEQARIDALAIDAQMGKRHLAEWREVRSGTAADAVAGGLQIGAHGSERTARGGRQRKRFVLPASFQQRFRRERIRLGPGDLRVGPQCAVGRDEPVDHQAMPPAVGMERGGQIREFERGRGRCRALQDGQMFERQRIDVDGQRQRERVGHGGGRSRLRGLGRRQAHVDAADGKRAHMQPGRRPVERPVAVDTVHGHAGVAAGKDHVAQAQPARHRAALVAAGQDAAGEARGDRPQLARAAFGAQRQHHGGHQQDHQQQQHAGGPGQRARDAAAAPMFRRRRRAVRAWHRRHVRHAHAPLPRLPHSRAVIRRPPPAKYADGTGSAGCRSRYPAAPGPPGCASVRPRPRR